MLLLRIAGIASSKPVLSAIAVERARIVAESVAALIAEGELAAAVATVLMGEIIMHYLPSWNMLLYVLDRISSC
ncbi:hypothetical protein UNDYM_1331 [Undibacterium sp. YM2]|nr:hypothetical protein UNDYM_1331 [Undibacterium sp. YM2]